VPLYYVWRSSRRKENEPLLAQETEWEELLNNRIEILRKTLSEIGTAIPGYKAPDAMMIRTALFEVLGELYEPMKPHQEKQGFEKILSIVKAHALSLLKTDMRTPDEKRMRDANVALMQASQESSKRAKPFKIRGIKKQRTIKNLDVGMSLETTGISPDIVGKIFQKFFPETDGDTLEAAISALNANPLFVKSAHAAVSHDDNIQPQLIAKLEQMYVGWSLRDQERTERILAGALSYLDKNVEAKQSFSDLYWRIKRLTDDIESIKQKKEWFVQSWFVTSKWADELAESIVRCEIEFSGIRASRDYGNLSHTISDGNENE
jgi:hypothetical protein